MVEIDYYNQVHLSPLLPYFETTNVTAGASFDGNFKAEFIDTCGIVLKDITNFVTITEIVIDGLQQFYFELLPTLFDYYKDLVFIKITHFSVNILSNLVLFSSPFLISELNFDKTIRFDFKKNANNQYLDSYSIVGFFDQYDSEQQASEYVSLTGLKVSSRLIETEIEKYRIEAVNQLNYKTLNHILSREIVYINGKRITNKQTNTAQERYDVSCNLQPYDFNVPINYKDVIDFTKFQTVPDFKITTTVPADNSTITGTVSLLVLNFNANVIIGSGSFKIFRAGVLIGIFNQTNFIRVSGTQLILTIPTISTLGNYYINFDGGLFVDNFGRTIAYNNTTDWNFSIGNPDFDNNDFDNNDFDT